MSNIPCEQIVAHGKTMLPADTPLYRYLSVDMYSSLFDKQELWLAKISSWDDVQEGLRFHAMKVKAPDHPYANKSLVDFYASCWSLQTEDNLLFESEKDYQRSVDELAKHGSDAMWRAYCPSGGVRIKTTLGKLEELLCSASLPTSELHSGQVYYDPYDSDWGKTLGSRYFASAFLQKRVCFRGEAEFRFLFCAGEGITDAHIKVPIQDLYHFIDEVLVSPAKLSSEEVIYKLKNDTLCQIAPNNVKDGKQFCRISHLYGIVGFNEIQGQPS